MRYLLEQIQKDLSKKMVFLGGARQVGKTTLAQSLLLNNEGYLNWDISEDRERILKRQLSNNEVLVFDELHKYRLWRNYLKGIYDQQKKQHKILVTGSARLDLYSYGGESLQGRYHYLRLHPLSFKELNLKTTTDLEKLIDLGSFPEQYYGQDKIESKRWSRNYRTRLIQEDISSIESIKDLGSLEHLMIRLPDLIGSPLSIKSTSEDLQISYRLTTKWLDILEKFYFFYRLSPFGSPLIRAVKKEQKHYQYDWTTVEDFGAKFENVVACHLLKWVHYQQDVYGEDIELRYLRDETGREVDFVISKKIN